MRAPRKRRRFDDPRDHVRGIPEIGGAGQRNRLFLVREQDVHPLRDQVQKGLPVPVHAERVGEGERDLAPGGAGGVGELHHCRLGRGRVPQIAFQIGDGRLGRGGFVDVRRLDLGSGAQHGEHAALGIGRHENQAAAPWRRQAVAAGVSNRTPASRISRRKAAPAPSSRTRPI